MKLLIVLSLSSLFLTGCFLQTRNDVHDNEGRQVMQSQVTTQQRMQADAGTRLSDMQEQMRDLTGRVDVVENKQSQNNSTIEGAFKNIQQNQSENNQKVAILQEALTKMENQVVQLTAEVQSLKAEHSAAAAAQAEKPAKQAKQDSYELAQEAFKKKDWKQAILNYQKYRDENPKGAKFPEATYKIGVAFQELGMKDEAKTFYDEVSTKFPKSEEAHRAKVRLKGLKK